jgi:hypothetical protein
VRPKHIAALIYLLCVAKCVDLDLWENLHWRGVLQSVSKQHSGLTNTAHGTRGNLQAFRRICLDRQIFTVITCSYRGVYHISNNVERTRSTFTIEHGCDIRLREYYLDANRSHSSSGHGG